MRRITTLAVLLVFLVPAAFADEGLWLFNAPPKSKIKDRYGFEITQQWLDHVREGSVRFNSGGSGSFVSPNGLAFTNHHVASDCVAKLGSTQKDYIQDGFLAKSQADELKCPDLELNVLTGIEDVTAKIQDAAKQAATPAEAGTAQRAAMSGIESECAKSGLRCDVVTLYSGGAYHLYKYKRYMDVRLVFAPEADAAQFGGDPDNFEFPRHGFDVAFFRVYENDKPVQVTNHLQFTTKGVKEGELVFMSGNPGSTARWHTMAQMEFLRDVQYPWQLRVRGEQIRRNKDFAAKSAENERIAHSRIYGLENGYKSLKGYNAALLDQDLMKRKAAAEEQLRSSLVNADPAIASAWSNLASAMEAQRGLYVPYILLERSAAFDGELADIARTLVRVTAEKQRGNNDRLREYRESNLPSVEQALFSEAPIYPDYEEFLLADSLQLLASDLPNNEATKLALGGKAAADRARELVHGTKLADVAFRRKLYEGGWAAVSTSDDPMIVLMRSVDAMARELRKQYDDQVDSVVRREGGRIAQARFKSGGLDLYPDATFTLRLSYGAVRGYTEDGRGSIVPKGTKIPYFTTMAGAFEREKKKGAKAPYKLPPSWHSAKSKVNLKTSMNFVSTADSIGGNSGSPIVNTAGELVGINFDRNMQGLGRNFYYSEEGMRHIAVDSRIIMEALRKIYKADALVNELMAGANK